MSPFVSSLCCIQCSPGGGGVGTPLYDLYEDVPLDIVCFFTSLSYYIKQGI